MRVAQIVPPQWSPHYHPGEYRMVLAHWVPEHPEYVQVMRSKSGYTIVDNGSFEGKQVSLSDLNEVCVQVNADEVVLPDAQGDPKETLRRSWAALGKLGVKRLMFVPQGSTVEGWLGCLDAWIGKWEGSNWEDTYELALGVTSLRTEPGGTEAQEGTRVELLKTVSDKYPDYPLHLLGVARPGVLCNSELPLSISLGVRGVDTSTAFALGAEGMLLTPFQPKVFLKTPEEYESLSTYKRRLIALNQRILAEWVGGVEDAECIPTHWIRQTASKWLKYWAEGFADLDFVMQKCGMPKGRYALLKLRRREKYIRPLKKGEKLRERELEVKV